MSEAERTLVPPSARGSADRGMLKVPPVVRIVIHGSYGAAGEILLGEQEWCCDAAVLQPTVTEQLIHVEIHAPTLPVVQHEVPRTVSWPRVDPIDSLVNEGCEQGSGIGCLDPDVEIRVWSGLLAHQRVDSPTSTDAGSNTTCL
jgi:hypothetical protein